MSAYEAGRKIGYVEALADIANTPLPDDVQECLEILRAELLPFVTWDHWPEYADEDHALTAAMVQVLDFLGVL